ncbi:MAG: 1,6-anhydro-N-acetylmuramyl-L-alanine amidase AmpD [Gammaproteobacteria bacterium]
MILPEGLIKTARYLPSPHCDARPENADIDMIVVHGISLPPGQFDTQYIETFFSGKLDESIHPYFATISSLKVSAHLLIARTGEIIQFVPFSKRAWHAGQSYFQGRERCNDFSIGIELEGTDDLPYEKVQYEQLAEVIKILRHAYPNITRDRIVGHSDIAPGRKTDPGKAFNWHELDFIIEKAIVKE